MRQRKGVIAVADAREFGVQVGQMVCHNVSYDGTAEGKAVFRRAHSVQRPA
jgi:hypothetical protein